MAITVSLTYQVAGAGADDPPVTKSTAVGVAHIRRLEELALGEHPLGARTRVHIQGEGIPLEVIERMGDVIRLMHN